MSGTATDPLDGARWRVDHGDALDVLRGLPEGCVDAVVTDPPYAAIGSSVSALHKGKGAWAPPDTQFFEAWLLLHLTEWRRVCHGAAWFTVDWHGALAVERVAFGMRLPRPSVGVWDRERMGMGRTLRSQCECFVVVPLSFDWKPPDYCEVNLWRHPWGPPDRKNGHPAEKPVEIIRRAVRLVCPPDGIVLDPLAGVGTTGEAALFEGRRALLIEREPSGPGMPDFAGIAWDRLQRLDAHTAARPLGWRPERPATATGTTTERAPRPARAQQASLFDALEVS